MLVITLRVFGVTIIDMCIDTDSSSATPDDSLEASSPEDHRPSFVAGTTTYASDEDVSMGFRMPSTQG